MEKVRAGLDRLRAEGRFDGPSIERVLTDAGLVDVESRKPGRLDTAGGGGLLFCGNSGSGYVFGEHGRDPHQRRGGRRDRRRRLPAGAGLSPPKVSATRRSRAAA